MSYIDSGVPYSKLGTRYYPCNGFINKKLIPKPQRGLGSYYGKKTGKFIINWKDTSKNIRNMIRVYSKPFNPAEAQLLNRYLLINKASEILDTKYSAQGCGIIVDIINEKPIISCAEGCLILDEFIIVPKLNKEEKDLYFKIGNKLE